LSPFRAGRVPRSRMHERDARRYAIAALVAVALTFVVVVASAFLRHSQAGLGCADWPACYARVAVEAQGAGVAFARGAHRIAASGAALAVIAMLAFGWRDAALRRRAALAFAIVAGLALLGVVTRGARLPAIALANLLGGFALFAVLVAAHASAARRVAASRGVRVAAGLAAVLVLLQAAVGGSIGAQSALLACPSFPGCEAASWHALVQGGAWNAFRESTIVDGRIVAPAGAAALHLVHRAGAIAVTLVVLGIVLRAPSSSGGLALLLGVVVAAGVGGTLVPSSLALAVVHNGCAALLLAMLARIAVAPVSDAATASAADGHLGYVPREARH